MNSSSNHMTNEKFFSFLNKSLEYPDKIVPFFYVFGINEDEIRVRIIQGHNNMCDNNYMRTYHNLFFSSDTLPMILENMKIAAHYKNCAFICYYLREHEGTKVVSYINFK